MKAAECVCVARARESGRNGRRGGGGVPVSVIQLLLLVRGLISITERGFSIVKSRVLYSREANFYVEKRISSHTTDRCSLRHELGANNRSATQAGGSLFGVIRWLRARACLGQEPGGVNLSLRKWNKLNATVHSAHTLCCTVQ